MSMYVNGYLKNPEAIKGETKTVGFYDVDYEKISPTKILENDISFPGSDLYLITELQSVHSLNMVFIKNFIYGISSFQII